MTTVGYGDFFPFTNLGRIIIIITAFTGSAIISMLALITLNKLSLSSTEQSIYEFGNRLEARKQKESSFENYYAKHFKYISYF